MPSEFGNEVDRVFGLPPFQALMENKRRVRRATEAAHMKDPNMFPFMEMEMPKVSLSITLPSLLFFLETIPL